MAEDFLDELLPYYQRELGYLRRAGAEFAGKYPKIGQRLELGLDASPDPHVERLIESFAFLTARLQLNIENEFPQIPSALLGMLYPQFLNPVPSMATARFAGGAAQDELADGFLVEKGSQLFAQTAGGTECRFRTCYPVTLWPLVVEHAGFENAYGYDFLDRDPLVVSVLRLRIATGLDSLEAVQPECLRFFLGGERTSAYALYESLCCNLRGLAILPEGSKVPIHLPADSLRPVGFEDDEAVLPYPPNALPAYRLLQEYFSFPEKFLFVDIDGLKVPQQGRYFDILLLLDRVPRSDLVVDRDSFQLGCTPIINLFSKTTEPIRLNRQQTEYRLIPDVHRERSTEIHSIVRVSSASDYNDTTQTVSPLFSFDHDDQGRQQKSYWYAERSYSANRDIGGTDVTLAFVDLDYNPQLPAADTVYAHTLCTNRVLAEQVPYGAELDIESATPVERIYCLTRPTPEIIPPLRGQTLWRLISHLSLNFLSLTEGQASLEALREILRLYALREEASVDQAVMGIREMTCQQVVRRLGDEAWRGFCRGAEIGLTFDERFYVGNSAFLLASVLNRFFALYASVNGFTQLAIRSEQRDGVWKQWPPAAGEDALL